MIDLWICMIIYIFANQTWVNSSFPKAIFLTKGSWSLKNVSIIFHINVESITKMLSLPEILNSKTWNQLKALGVNVRTFIIMDATKVLTKKNLVQHPQIKCSSIQRSTKTFMKIYKELV